LNRLSATSLLSGIKPAFINIYTSFYGSLTLRQKVIMKVDTLVQSKQFIGGCAQLWSRKLLVAVFAIFLASCSVVDVRNTVSTHNVDNPFPQQAVDSIRAKKTSLQWLVKNFGEPNRMIAGSGGERYAVYQFQQERQIRVRVFLLWRSGVNSMESQHLVAELDPDNKVVRYWQEKDLKRLNAILDEQRQVELEKKRVKAEQERLIAEQEKHNAELRQAELEQQRRDQELAERNRKQQMDAILPDLDDILLQERIEHEPTIKRESTVKHESTTDYESYDSEEFSVDSITEYEIID
jgi:hypothetical protein